MKDDEKPYFKEIDKIVGRVIQNTTKFFSVEPMAEGLSIPGGEFRGVYIFFQNNGELTRERIEEILLSASYDILERLNSNEIIRPQMVTYPFTLKQLNINLILLSEDGREVVAPNLTSASIRKGLFKFKTVDESTNEFSTLDSYPASESKYYRGEK